MRNHLPYVVGILLFGCALRLTGTGRGLQLIDAPASGGEPRAVFRHFHPDEETILRAALELRTPLDPPLTAYGLVPLYAARAVLSPFGAGGLDAPDGGASVYLPMRWFAALLSCATLGLVYLLGCSLFDRQTAALGTLFTAAAPLAVQQAHFYTVDGLFLFASTAALWALARARACAPTWRQAAASGTLIGLAAAIRLNGLLLLPVAVAVQVLGRGWRDRLSLPAATAASALLTLVLLEPYLVTSPQRLWRDESSDDFLFSALVASGDRLRLWTLVDRHTWPYLHHWIDLFPAGVGWPLTLLFVAGLLFAALRRRTEAAVLLLWSSLHFFTVGGLFTKHVRYLLPLLPSLSLLGAAAGLALWRSARPPVLRLLSRGLVAAVALYTSAYGVAYAGIYRQPDSRLAAADWLERHASFDSAIGLERGGFSAQELFASGRHNAHFLDIARLFHLRDYLSCGAEAGHLARTLSQVDYLVVVDANRLRQVTAAADLLPATAGFYRALTAGDLGFRRAFAGSVRPRILGVPIGSDSSDPSFAGVDHPAVYIFQKEPVAADAIRRWEAAATGDAHCPDRLLRSAVARLAADSLDGALHSARQIPPLGRGGCTADLLLAAIHQRRGDRQPQAEAAQRFRDGFFGAEAAHLIPWASALTLGEAGDDDLALSALLIGVQQASSQPTPDGVRREMADSYAAVAAAMRLRGREHHALVADHFAEQVLAGSGVSATAPPPGR